MDGHGRKQPARGQRTADGRTLAYPGGGGRDRIAHRQARHYFSGNAQRIQHRHRAGGEDAQSAGKAGGIEAAQELAGQRQGQQPLVDPPPVCRIALPAHEQDARAHQDQHQPDAVVPDEIAQGHQHPGHEWQLRVAVFKHLHHLGHDVGEQN